MTPGNPSQNNKVPVPVLSSQGWEHDTPTQLDVLLAHCFVAQYSQTHLFKDQVLSVPWILQKYTSISDVTNQIETRIEVYLRSYFDTVTVACREHGENTNPSSKCVLDLYISVTSNGVEYELTNRIRFINSVFDKLVRLNNLGEDINDSRF